MPTVQYYSNMSSGNLKGWLSTKKTGRDDKAIAAAKQQAIEDRRVKRGLAPTKKKAAPAKNGKAKKQPPPKKKGKKTADDDYEEDDDDDEDEIEYDASSGGGSESDFSVGDEEEEEEDMVSLHDNDDSDDDANSDDDDGGHSFLPKSKKKKVNVKPMLEQTEKLKARNNNRKKGLAQSQAPKLKLKPVSRSSTSQSSDDDEDNNNNNNDNKFEDDDVEDYMEEDTAKKPVAKRKKKITSKTIDIAESDSDSDAAPASKKKAVTSKYFKQQAEAKKDYWDSDDDDTPVKPKAAATKATNQRKRAIHVDDTEDDITPAKAKGSRNLRDDSSDDDDGGGFNDEDMQLALKQSMKGGGGTKKKAGGNRLKKLQSKSNNKQKATTTANNNKRKKVSENDSPSAIAAAGDGFLEDSEEEEAHREEVDESEEEPLVIELDDASSSEDENANDDEEDVYADEEAREASLVLATANDLSASVLRIMASWNSDDNNDGGDGEVEIPQGMIVDGAISLTSLGKRRTTNNSSSNSNNHNPSWISAETMQKVLPKEIDLKGYQLLGVNWLAMLHSMTCKVTTSKKPTNVNGVLADEMGLGKTCQTIAFMAWLKYSRSKGDMEEAGSSELPKKKAADSDDDLSDVEDAGEAIDDEVDAKPPAKRTPTATTPNNKFANVSVRRNDEESSPLTRLPHLVVVPASVVANWEREFKTFAPNLHIVRYHGTMDERQELQRILRPYLPKHRDPNIPMVDVVLTSITYFQKESGDDRDFLRRFNFDYMVIDEGHLLKNAKGLRYKNLNRFKSRHRLLLTGTPVQNTPKELMALLCFLMPLFSQKAADFGEDNEFDGGEGMLQHFVQLEENAAHVREDSHEFAYKKLKQLFAPFVLRRKKVDVLADILPPKSYQVEFVDLGEAARQQYDSIIAEHVKAKRNKTKSVTDSLFTSLRKASHHPLLLRTRHTSPEEKDHLAHWFFQSGAFRGEASSKERVSREMDKYNDFEIHLTAHELLEANPLRGNELNRYILTEEDLFQSEKFVRLREMLPNLISSGHRILIFSVWTSCLDLLGVMLDNLGFGFMRMDGQTAVSERQGLIDQFNKETSIPIFLLSTMACGMGINLTSADICIMHDINMNPFNDLQAEDRCHRIGQGKPVTVIKLISKDCVDSDIYNMQERKKKMNAAIMDAPATERTKEEKKAKTQMIKNAVDRYMSSPKPASGKNSKSTSVAEKENLKNTKADSEECRDRKSVV